MKIRPGRMRSLIAGIMALVVMAVGLVMMSGAGGFGPSMMPGVGGIFTIFKILWVVVGLVGAGAAFYNAFSREGLPLYEIETERSEDEEGQYCPQCGRSVSANDKFCRNCGAPLD